jgi:hypothetical protein
MADETTTTTATDEVSEAVAALESAEPVAEAVKAEEEKEAKEANAEETVREAVRAEAAALRARLRAEREARMARQRAAEAPPVQQQQQQQQQQPSTQEEDALVRAVREAIGAQAGEKLDPRAIEAAVARVVQQQLASYEEAQRKHAAKLAVVAHLESARERLPLLSSFADDRLDEVYDVLLDEYADEYRSSGKKLTVAEAAERVEKKLTDAITRLSGLTARQQQQQQEQKSNKKRRASADDEDPEAAMREAIAALTSREPRS